MNRIVITLAALLVTCWITGQAMAWERSAISPKETKAIAKDALTTSQLNDNVQYLRFVVDPRLAEGKRAEFNVYSIDEYVSYTIALRNGVIALTKQHNRGPAFNLTKNDWSQLITGEKRFVRLHSSLKAFDEAIDS